MAKINYKAVALTLGLIAFSFLFVWYIFAWTEPSAVPPGGNVLAPLNVGPDAQAKEGMLWLAYNPAVTTGLIVEYGNVGIGTSSPDYSLHIVNPSDTRNKMFFDSSKGAFRAGYASTDEWDDVNIGSKSIAMGLDTTASGPWSIAIGRFSTAVGQASAAIGEGATASGARSIAIGVSNTASGTNSTAIGAGTTASGFNSMALGVGTVAGGHHSVAISNWIDVMGDYSVGIALDNAASYVITQDNTMAIMGGNVGIGTTDPGKKLDVVGGEIRSDAGLCITGASPECISDWPAGGGGFWAANEADDIYNINTGNVGIGTTSPEFKLTIDNDGGIIAKGTRGIGNIPPTMFGVSQLIWYPRKAAFRAGYVASNEWADINIGEVSVALGSGTTASGLGSVALGIMTEASERASTAMGNITTASGQFSTAMGSRAVASGWNSIAMGNFVLAGGDYSVAIGQFLSADAYSAMVIGNGPADATRLVNNTVDSLAVGFNSDIPTLFVGPSSGVGTTGNVGIGTTSPQYKLDVNGQARIDGAVIRKKTGNNGTVSGDTYCQGTGWGGWAGTCIAQKRTSDNAYFPCSTTVGSSVINICVQIP